MIKYWQLIQYRHPNRARTKIHWPFSSLFLFGQMMFGPSTSNRSRKQTECNQEVCIVEFEKLFLGTRKLGWHCGVNPQRQYSIFIYISWRALSNGSLRSTIGLVVQKLLKMNIYSNSSILSTPDFVEIQFYPLFFTFF